MNNVFTVSCSRVGPRLRAPDSRPPAVVSALCLIRQYWLGTVSTGSSDGPNTSRSRHSWAFTREQRNHLSLLVAKHEPGRTKSLANLAIKSPFHSSAICSKSNRTPRNPSIRPVDPPHRPRGSRFLDQGKEKPPSPQEPSPKSRYKRNVSRYQPPQDFNPSGKPIYIGSAEWKDCVKNVTLAPFTKEQVESIFGDVLTVSFAQEILKVLQFQRLTGTLDHGVAVPQLTNNLIANALQFLREKEPFDEDAAIMARIEREYDAEEAEADGEPAYVPQQGAEETGIYGKPGLDAMRAERKAEQEQKEAERERLQAEQGQDATPPAPRPTFREKALAARQQESAEWVRKYKEKALLSDGPAPDMPLRQRLLPSALFTLATVAGCLALAAFYVPPPRVARLFPDTPPAAATVLTLMAMNAAVFVAWRIPPLWRFMNHNFILVAGAPKAFTLLGGTFSHHTLSHLAVNMAGLWVVGTWLHDDIGRGNFLATYVAGGVLTSMLALTAYVLKGTLNVSTLGASGAVFTLVAARCVLHAGEKFQVPFLPADSEVSVRPLLLLGCLVAVEVVALRRAPHLLDQAVDRTSHISALGIGSVLGALLRLKMEAQEKRQPRPSFGDLAARRLVVANGPDEQYDVTVTKPAAAAAAAAQPPPLQ